MGHNATLSFINAYQYWKETPQRKERKDEDVSEAFDGDEYSHSDILSYDNL
jgi:hypothetical protein